MSRFYSKWGTVVWTLWPSQGAPKLFYYFTRKKGECSKKNIFGVRDTLKLKRWFKNLISPKYPKGRGCCTLPFLFRSPRMYITVLLEIFPWNKGNTHTHTHTHTHKSWREKGTRRWNFRQDKNTGHTVQTILRILWSPLYYGSFTLDQKWPNPFIILRKTKLWWKEWIPD